MNEYLKYAAVLFALIIVQKFVINLIDVTEYKITPDIVLIGLIYISVKKGKITGSIAGFLSGMILDLLSFSFIGLMALAKTTAGFIAGFFYDEHKSERYLNSFFFIFIVVICSLINNTIYYYIYFQGTSLVFADIIFKYVIPTTVYTAIFALFPVAFAKKRAFAR